MSMGTFDRNRPFGPEARHEDRIADREDVAIDPDIEFVEADEEAYSTDNEGTASTGRPEQDWFATLLFALDHQPIPLRVDWNDLEDMQRSAAHVLEISYHNLFYLHHVQHAPQDLVDAGVEVLIGHRHGDIAQGSSLQLVLLDVEFHSAVPAIQHEVVRRIVRIPRQIGRLALLHRLGLAAYCRRTKQNCILWCNGEIISHYSARPMDIMHGTYLRIAVPPGDNTINHIGTKCIATACHQGVTLTELCDRHALFALGRYDTIVGQPLVPLRPDEEEVALLQRKVGVPPLPERPWFINGAGEFQIDAIVPEDHAEEDVGDITRDYVNRLDQGGPGGINPRPGLDGQPERIQNLVDQLEEHGGLEMEQEGPVLHVNTWFLSRPNQRHCTEYRTVRLAGNFGHWHDQFLRT